MAIRNLLPEAFLLQMQNLLGTGTEFEDFLHALEAPAPTSIHWHLKKNNLRENFDKVKWYSEGVYLTERPIFTLDPAFHAGSYYVQEASSMLVAEAARQLIDNQCSLTVLDLCAAPGGKSTLLATILSETAFILCNEVIKSRYPILRENLTKWGCSNVHSLSHDSQDFTRLEGFFDLVLVDAPCSGEGLFRKDKRAIAEWSPDSVQRCAARQKRILADAVKMIKPGGNLIYCTCTYNDLENEQNAAWLIKTFDLERIPLSIPNDWGIRAKNIGYQCYPHEVRGEGFYIACFKKNTGADFKPAKNGIFPKWKPFQAMPMIQKWLKTPEHFYFFQDEKGTIFAILKTQLEHCQLIAQQFRHWNLGLEIGTIKGKDFIPSHALALSTDLAPDLPTVALDKEQALRFLKKENVSLDFIPESWALVTFEKQPIGWIKGIGNRINNYFPKDWRILMELPSEL